MPVLNRRHFLTGLGLSAALLTAPGLALAALPGDRRFVFVALRGAMDGLHAVPPVGDPDYAAARGALALKEGVIPLEGIYGLHPALGGLSGLYRKGELLLVHAVASPYRERSHFDGQDVLEGGGTAPHLLLTGWLGRSLPLLGAGRSTGLAVGQSVPLSLRGPQPVESWSPSPLAGLSPSLVEKLRGLYEGDALLSMALEEGVQSESFVAQTLGGGMARGGGGNFRSLAEATGKLLAAVDGPRIAVMDAGGWDTHTAQGNGQQGRMVGPLNQLGDGLAAMAQAMGPAWSKTIVVCASEFGRTVAMNGTNGTDHGTGGVALLAGGAVAGGRVVAKWPGLSKAALYQGRDLMPTSDLRAVLKGVLRDHLGLSETALAKTVFPGSDGLSGMSGLVKMV
jgi:uncharacterized protein (DUF1501 family)